MLRTLVDRLSRNLTDGIGERGTDRIFRRSFSALTLSVVVARDNLTPFLALENFRRIERAALAYLEGERDLRGYDPQHSWMHSAAHTADLLKFLARSRHLEGPGQAQLLEAIAGKLSEVPMVFTHGEDERFARAVLSIVGRPDFDAGTFTSWTSRIKPKRPGARPTTAELIAAQNLTNLSSKLLVLLDADARPSDAAAAARRSVRAALDGAF